MPVIETTLRGVESPNACVSAEDEAGWALPVRRARSTLTPFMGEGSSISPPSHTALPATLWPPERTPSDRSCVRAKSTPGVTSAVRRNGRSSLGACRSYR